MTTEPNDDRDSLAAFLKGAVIECEKYETCMGLSVCEEGSAVELILDTSLNTYGEWIKGEGGDICLYREFETNRVVGCRLPLLNNKLCIHHKGPIRINTGFIKDQTP